MKCQRLFSENNVITLFSADFVHRVVKVKMTVYSLETTNNPRCPARSGDILSWRLIMKFFLSFSPFR